MESSNQSSLRFLLLQIRNDDDPMLVHEVESFCVALSSQPERMATANLLSEIPSKNALEAADLILIGGSGDYSATDDAPWLDRICELLQQIHAIRKPLFGSCWGFQALARAFGGQVVHDLQRAELGTLEVALTVAGRQDPVFGPLGDRFFVPVGHEDTVIALPDNCTLLGSTDIAYQILRFDDAPIYATQFHPELTKDGLLARAQRYPRYVHKIRGVTVEQFASECQETPKMTEILPRFIHTIFGS